MEVGFVEVFMGVDLRVECVCGGVVGCVCVEGGHGALFGRLYRDVCIRGCLGMGASLEVWQWWGGRIVLLKVIHTGPPQISSYRDIIKL